MFKRNGAGYTETQKGIVGTEIGKWGTTSNGFLQGTPELGACVPPVGVLHDSGLRLQGMHAGVWNFKLKPKEQWKVRSAKKEELKRKRVEETATPATLTRSALDKMGAESLLSLSSSWLDTEEEGSEKGQDEGSKEGSQVGKPGANETPAAGAEFSPPKLDRQAACASEVSGGKPVSSKLNSLLARVGVSIRLPLAPPDWSSRAVQASLDCEIAEEPRLWMYSPASGERHEQEALRLFKLCLEGKSLSLSEVNTLKDLYGLVVSQIIRKFCLDETTATVVAVEAEPFKEIQEVATSEDCAECKLTHGSTRHPVTGQIGMCCSQSMNNPKLLDLVTGEFASQYKGVIIGLQALRTQPPHLVGQLLNLSAIGVEEYSVGKEVGVTSTQREAREQPLYKLVAKRLERIRAVQGLPLYIEYVPPTLPGSDQDDIPLSWGVLRVVQVLQQEYTAPIILLLPPPLPPMGSTQESFGVVKEKWLGTARRLGLMAAAMGVGFSPLVVHGFEVNKSLVIRGEYKTEFLHNSRQGSGREYYRRIACWFTKLQKAAEAATLPRRILLTSATK
jgi:hypothetical protein